MGKRTERLQLKSEHFFANLDYWLLIPVLLMTLIGLVTLNYIFRGYAGYPFNIYKQMIAVIIGIFLSLLIALLDMPTLRLLGYGLYGLSVFLLFVVRFDGYSLKDATGADAWLNLPGFGTFQPSELTKIALAILTAMILAELKERRIMPRLGYLKLALIYFVPLVFIVKQPDLGTAMVIIFMLVCMLFIWGIRWRYIISSFCLLVVSIPLAWNYYFDSFQKKRFLSFLFPGYDPDASHNVDRAKSAIQAGGLTGSKSGIPVEVPVKESDFIYSAVGEYLGFIGTTALIILILIFIYRVLYISSQIKEDETSSLIMLGLIAGMTFHFLENMGMTVGLVPVTGIPLPFVSHGGTAMVSSYIALGVMLNISLNRRIQKKRM